MDEIRKRNVLIVGIAVSLWKKMFQDYSWESEPEEQEYMKLIKKRRVKPLRINNYIEKLLPELSDGQFQAHFLISRMTYNRLLPLMVNIIGKKTVQGRPEMDVERQLLASLWLLATPDSYRSVGERFNMGKNSLSVAFFRVVNALNKLSRSFIKWPTSYEIDHVKNNFYLIAGVDNCIGAVDGTFTIIEAPKIDPEVYITRKCNYAITLQAVCNANLRFTDCFVGYPGSVSDTRVFRNSDIYKNISEDPLSYFLNEQFIVGDKAYPFLTWCIPLYIDYGNLNNRRRHFNHVISQTRQVIERAFALLFDRFRRLKYLEMNRTDMIPATVLACCVLHNICLDNNEINLYEYIDIGLNTVHINEGEYRYAEPNHKLPGNRDAGIMKRDHLCNSLYNLS